MLPYGREVKIEKECGAIKVSLPKLKDESSPVIPRKAFMKRERRDIVNAALAEGELFIY